MLGLPSFKSLSIVGKIFNLLKVATIICSALLFLQVKQVKDLMAGPIGIVLAVVAGLVFVSALLRAMQHTLKITFWGAIAGFLFLQVFPGTLANLPGLIMQKMGGTAMQNLPFGLPNLGPNFGLNNGASNSNTSVTPFNQAQLFQMLSEMKKMYDAHANSSDPNSKQLTDILGKMQQGLQQSGILQKILQTPTAALDKQTQQEQNQHTKKEQDREEKPLTTNDL